MLYGRDVERARIGALLDAARAGRSGTLVLRGEPGIGKTALLKDAAERAADMSVLWSRGIESESELPFAALHQLVLPALGLVDRIPPPQAEALREALGLAAGTGRERFLVFAGCLSLLSELAEQRPVLCVIDDAHWLDAASADALRFVARRLDAERVAMLFAARAEETQSFEAADLPVLALGGLDEEAAARLLAQGAGVDAAPTVRRRLVEQTGGNALALLELPVALTHGQLTGNEPLPEALPLTRHVESVFLERVQRLSADAQRFLLLAAADESEHLAYTLAAARSLDVSHEALDEAEHTGLVVVHGARLEFKHPLVRSAVYDAATSSERRAAHRALADALPDDDEHADRRAWHLAASVLEPDEDVVAQLEEAAARAERRGAFMASSRALERAAELSVDAASKARRLVAAAHAASVAGLHERAAAIAGRARNDVTDVASRAELDRICGVAEIQQGHPLDAVADLMRAAKAVVPIDARQALELLMYVINAASDGGDLAAQLEAARLAEAVRPDEGDEYAETLATVIIGAAALAAGDMARGIGLIETSIEWATQSTEDLAVYWASAPALWLSDSDRTIALATRAAGLARASGSLGILAGALAVRGSACLVAQRFDEAEVAAAEAAQLTRELRSGNFTLLALGVTSSIAALRGRDEEARRVGETVLERGTRQGMITRVAAARRTLGWLDLGRQQWDSAFEHFEALAELGQDGVWLLHSVMTAPDRIEAAVRARRPERALLALEAYEKWATASGAPWARPRVISCRAILADSNEQESLFEEALALAPDARPFDLARIRLLYGEHLRRERRRVDARVQLRAALDTFERLSLEPWADRARAELGATGETARTREPGAIDQLTPQELQIARLVGQGLSNKEIAAQLFLSPRTIDSHLRNVFSKLSIRSRTQLARLALDDGEPESAPLAVTQ